MKNNYVLGYSSTLSFRSNIPYTDPLILRQGYTRPHLTLVQHIAVICTSAFVTACVSRPLTKFDRFYFLSDVPGESNRVVLSDKRAEFFRTLFNTRWLAGSSLLWGIFKGSFCLGAFIFFRNQAPFNHNGLNGLAAGSLTGLSYALLRHPYDVLCATAEAPGRPKAFRGCIDVLWTALRKKPAVLLGLYRGLSAVAFGRSAQYGMQFGLYNFLRFDGVYRGPIFLFLYCHFATFLGLTLYYPFVSMRHQLHLRNALTHGRRITYCAFFRELRRRFGLTKVYDGFFASKPFLNAIPPALLLLLYDVLSRRYTEYLHPQEKAPAAPSQPLFYIEPRPYVRSPEPYAFEQSFL